MTDADGNRQPLVLPPGGPRHSYAPLALHDPQQEPPFADCRWKVQPLCASNYGSGEGIGGGLVWSDGE